ncbi:MAG: hypothetical protein A3G76_03350 [Acidobacteria bacterium RIFCSPLOWO2_12_FULL_65_11]|nr:MAG: hypothetical protein A3G76_03350 [Acidobacteria bacterium RIFCSPLOWO2_12_FULL_65_11]
MNELALPRPAATFWSFREGLWLSAVALIAAYLVDDWIGGASVVVLWMVWHYLRTDDGLPILAFALTFQWFQVTAGLWYFAVTGRRIATMEISDYRPMVLIGLGCVLALTAGLYWGMALIRRSRIGRGAERHAFIPLGWVGLITLYVCALAGQGFMQQLAYQYPDLTQPILTLRFVHLAVLFVILRRLIHPVARWPLLVPLIGLELFLGVTGFFAGFREPLIMAAMALFQAFDARRVQHWLALGVCASLMLAISVFWIGVRRDFRAEFDNETFSQSRGAQFDYLTSLYQTWSQQEASDLVDNVDQFVDRMWVVYYPALAVSRVPSALAHTDGALMSAALQHVFSPRVFFPTKAEVQNDSEMVRKYSGVWVAGDQTGTSIAFGYAAESYIDFGVPWMFVPMLAFGFLMGLGYQVLSSKIRHDELRAGLVAVIFWIGLYLFERSWVKTIGVSGTMFVYLAVPALLLDYYLCRFDLPAGEPVFDPSGRVIS